MQQSGPFQQPRHQPPFGEAICARKVSSAISLEKNGIALVGALAMFEDPQRIERIDLRRDYRGERVEVIGKSKGRVLFVVYTRRGPADLGAESQPK